MENWKELVKDLGEVPKKSVVTVIFEAKEGIKNIATIKASCGCTTPVYDLDNRTLTVSFKTGVIPFHLRKQGYYLANKKITVYYEDGTFTELFIKAKIL